MLPQSLTNAGSRTSAIDAAFLIIEDDPLIAHHLASLLEDLELRVCAFADSQGTAVSKAQDEQPDLILADIQLRGIGDGISAVQEIWKERFVPVVFVTGNREELLRRGMGHLTAVSKPFVPSTLRQAVRVALSGD